MSQFQLMCSSLRCRDQGAFEVLCLPCLHAAMELLVAPGQCLPLSESIVLDVGVSIALQSCRQQAEWMCMAAVRR